MREYKVRHDNTHLFLEVCARCNKVCSILKDNMSLMTRGKIVKILLLPLLQLALRKIQRE